MTITHLEDYVRRAALSHEACQADFVIAYGKITHRILAWIQSPHPGLCPNAGSIPQIVGVKNVSRHYQMSPEGQNHPS